MRILHIIACILLTFTLTRLYDNARIKEAAEAQRLKTYCHSFGINDAATCEKLQGQL